MKTSHVKFVVVSLTALIFSLTSHASVTDGLDGGHVGGGDKRCAEFYDLASNIAVLLVKAGQPTLDSVNPLIDVKRVWDRVKDLKVLPAKRLPRQAVTDPKALTTQLDVKQWARIDSYSEKIRLVSHELMVLTEAENDGLYVVSKDLYKFLSNTSEIGARMKSTSIFENADGSSTILSPFIYVGNGLQYLNPASDVNGVCRYLGFSGAVGDGNVTIDPNDMLARTVLVDAQGTYNGAGPVGRTGYYWVNSKCFPEYFWRRIASIVCQ